MANSFFTHKSRPAGMPNFGQSAEGQKRRADWIRNYKKVQKSVASTGMARIKKTVTETPKPTENKITDPTYNNANKAQDQNTPETAVEDTPSGGNNNEASQSGSNLYSYLNNGRKRRGTSDLRITGVNRGYRG